MNPHYSNPHQSNARQSYVDGEVLSADPVRLIELLCRGAVDAIESARRQVRNGNIHGRARSIAKASAILTELSTALDHTRGGELSRNLGELYDYMQRLLMDANFGQCEPPLAEAEKLMRTLLEAWQGCRESFASSQQPVANGAGAAAAEALSLAC